MTPRQPDVMGAAEVRHDQLIINNTPDRTVVKVASEQHVQTLIMFFQLVH